MTQNIMVTANNAVNNPLYIKMRRRFSYQGNRTIAEAMIQRAIREGYTPHKSSPPKTRTESERSMCNTLSEDQIKRANSLPRPSTDTVAVKTPSVKSSGRGEYSLERTAICSTKTESVTVKNEKRTPLPLSVMFVIMLCAALMMILVYSGIQISRMSREISSLQSQSFILKNEASDLEVALEAKNDMTLIESIATSELGMVKQSAVEHVYIGVYTDDSVEVYESTEGNSSLIANLLNAFMESFD